MNDFEKLTELFKKLPGVGTRQAQRFAHFVVRQDGGYAKEFSEAIKAAKGSSKFCLRCRRLAFGLDDSGLCGICSSPNRDKSILLIVEKDADLDHIERAHIFEGVYFVLGGVLPMRDDDAASFIRLKELEDTLKPYLEQGLEEVILGLSLTPEGEYTSNFLDKKIRSLAFEQEVKISMLGRGLSVGSELEYSDKETLRYALGSRK